MASKTQSGIMSLFYDLYQNGKIHTAEIKAGIAKDAAKRAEEEVRDLRQRVDGLTLACQAALGGSPSPHRADGRRHP